jgi:hypothetical protein
MSNHASHQPRVLLPGDHVPPLPALLTVLARYKADDGSWPPGLVNLRWLIVEATRRSGRADGAAP